MRPIHPKPRCIASLLVVLALGMTITEAYAKPAPQESVETLTFDSMLSLPSAGRSGRGPVFTDALEARLVAGTFEAPIEGSTLDRADGTTLTWTAVQPNENGKFAQPRGGYLFGTVESQTDRVMLLDASGHRHAYVNGVPRGGDVYNLGLMRIPVVLRKGTNEFLFKAGRGRLSATLVAPTAPVFFEKKDRVQPDVVVGEGGSVWLGLGVTNATNDWWRGGSITAVADDGALRSNAVAPIPPAMTRRIPVEVIVPKRPASEKVSVRIELRDATRTVVASETLELPTRAEGAKHRRTFVSDIDGSVQYFAVTPPAPESDPASRPAMFLSLHGASVQATNQAYSYQAKDWGVVVAPTNRRPFGFDWEDWGRLDALEVLAIGERLYQTDPERTYLTGHSMGGHGTWNIGAHYPDRFAAIAPSAGWRDFWSYAGATDWSDPDPIQAHLKRAANASRTLLLSRNYLHGGVYVLHGDADNNVPVSQARFMREHLAAFHPNFAYYERPGAGHWWGNQCMDWPPLFDFLEANRRPADHEVTELEFATVNPGISSKCYWVTIESQTRSMEPSRIGVKLASKDRALALTTENVDRFTLDLRSLSEPRTVTRRGKESDATVLAAGEPLSIDIDGTTISVDWPEDATLRFDRNANGWTTSTSELDPSHKGPHRAGPFKDAFRHRMIFVYGTAGTGEETAWAYAKARYDAETFQFRGNGAIEILPDTAFDPARHPDRGIVLYGNADTHKLWDELLGDSPIQVRRDSVRVGDRALEGDDLACLLVRPRPGSDRACVAVVSGTGLAGHRLTHQLPYFVSGVGYPDWSVFSGSMLATGSEGVLATGFFGPDWSLERGDAAWRSKE